MARGFALSTRKLDEGCSIIGSLIKLPVKSEPPLDFWTVGQMKDDQRKIYRKLHSKILLGFPAKTNIEDEDSK